MIVSFLNFQYLYIFNLFTYIALTMTVVQGWITVIVSSEFLVNDIYRVKAYPSNSLFTERFLMKKCCVIFYFFFTMCVYIYFYIYISFLIPRCIDVHKYIFRVRKKGWSWLIKQKEILLKGYLNSASSQDK